MDIQLLVKITARAWSLEILSLLHQGVAGRQAPLLRASGAGRTAFAASLAHLGDLGLLIRNPGHGHPLRPEFCLTPLGVQMAKVAYDVSQSVTVQTDVAALRRSWTVPVLALAHQPRRFGEFKSTLGGITDRALSQTLGQLQDRDWLRRNVDVAARPLRPTYHAANTGLAIAQAVRGEMSAR